MTAHRITAEEKKVVKEIADMEARLQDFAGLVSDTVCSIRRIEKGIDA